MLDTLSRAEPLLSHPSREVSILDALQANTQELAEVRKLLTELVSIANRHPFITKFLSKVG